MMKAGFMDLDLDNDYDVTPTSPTSRQGTPSRGPITRGMLKKI